jgi:hypothetical protein
VGALGLICHSRSAIVECITKLRPLGIPTVCFTIATGHNFVNLSPPRIPGRFPIFLVITVATNETKRYLDFQVSLSLAGKKEIRL